MKHHYQCYLPRRSQRYRARLLDALLGIEYLDGNQVTPPRYNRGSYRVQSGVELPGLQGVHFTAGPTRITMSLYSRFMQINGNGEPLP